MARKERVTKVIDGDTFRTSHRKKSIRLADVDAPEKGRRGATTATRYLKSLISNKIVTVEVVARDIYGRTVANVKVGRRSVNKAMREKLK